jgi:hypothetical protein
MLSFGNGIADVFSICVEMLMLGVGWLGTRASSARRERSGEVSSHPVICSLTTPQ